MMNWKFQVLLEPNWLTKSFKYVVKQLLTLQPDKWKH